MNDVGGSESGTGLRAVKSSRSSDANFEYDDSEWDVGITDLIIDLDADIEKNNEANRNSSSVSGVSNSGSSVINSGTGNSTNSSNQSNNNNNNNNTNCNNNINNNSSNSSNGVGNVRSQQQQHSNSASSTQMHIPRSPSSVTTGNSAHSTLKTKGSGSSGNSSSSSSNSGNSGNNNSLTGSASSLHNSNSASSSSSSSAVGAGGKASSAAELNKNLSSSVSMEVKESGLKMKIKRSKPGTKSVDAKHEIVKTELTATLTSSSVSSKNTSLNIPDPSNSGKAGGHGKEKLLERHDNSSNNSKSDDSSGGSSANNNSADQGSGGKGGKAAKRGGSTHKKVKSGGVTSGNSGANNSATAANSGGGGGGGNSSGNKKDSSNSDAKSNSAITSSSSSSSGHVKDMIYNVSVGSSGGSSSSAFVKTSNASSSSTATTSSSSSSTTLKVPTTTGNSSSSGIGNSATNSSSSDPLGNSGGGTQGATGSSASAGGAATAAAFRSHHSNSSNVSNAWATGSPAKGEKGRLSPSVTSSNADKLSNTNNSPSYGKKSRVFIPPDKTSSQEDSVSHSHGNISGSNSSGSSSSSTNNNNNNNNSSTYRTSVTLSSASLNDLTSSSCSSSILHQGMSLQSGTTVLSSFNVPKVENKAGRNQQQQQQQQQQQSTPSTTQDACIGTSVGTVTEPDCLGPCEPGTSVTLEGIVWHETESGVLVVNVTWRGKTYVGTLLDCTKNDWAPPRFCDSPTSDLEMRTPKNRGKRGRAQAATPVNEPTPADTRQSNAKLRNGVKGRRGSSSNAAFATPVSPLKPEPFKRKTRGSENDKEEEPAGNAKNAKRPKVSSAKDNLNSPSKDRQSSSPAPPNVPSSVDAQPAGGPFSPALIECPEPNCSKKYKHINGLRYHQSHAHSNTFTPEDSDSNMSTASTTNVNATTNAAAEANGERTTVPAGAARNNETGDANDSRETSRMDVDMEIVSATESENNNASSTGAATSAKRPAKESNNDKVYDINADVDINSSTKDNSEESAPIALTKSSANTAASKTSKHSTDAKEKADSEKATNEPKDSNSSVPLAPPATTTVGRTPILTVPTPFISLQNRAGSHHHRGDGNTAGDKSNRDDLNVIKGQSSGPLPAPSSTTVSKAAPWQPHAHTHSSHSQHAAHVISSLHSSAPQSIPVPLTVPVINTKDHDKNKSSKDKPAPGDSQPPSKKAKHKKKSKEKDRERVKDSSKGSSGSVPSKLFPGGQNNADKPKDLTEKRSSVDECDKDSAKGAAEPGTTEGGDNPQSPAYSDISDANDSGPEIDQVAAKENCVKIMAGPADLAAKKDTVIGVGIPPAHGISSFFPSFYSPYMDNPTGSNPPPKDGNRPPVSEEPEPKSKGKPHTHGHPLHSNIPPGPPNSVGDERRSPKMDYNMGGKYMPGHYFAAPYPYSANYYDQPYGSGMLPPEGGYPPGPHGRVFIDEKEREQERSKGKPGDKDEPQGLIGNIKQEPGTERVEKSDRRDKDSRSMQSVEKEPVEIKMEFGENYPTEKRGINLMPPQHFMPCSKHSKEAKRDDRHGNSGSSGKESDKESVSLKSGRNSVESSKSSKNADRDSVDGEKDGKDNKNEGAKPTMETQGPPPPPTAGSYAYIPQSYLQGSPFGLPFDPGHPLYRQVLVPGPYGGNPYMHGGPMPRYPPAPGSTPLPEDLSRPSGSAPPPAGSKALDLLQHHAAQYYASHKIHELQERALKSPSPQVNTSQGAGPNLSSTPSSPGINIPERGGRGNIIGGNVPTSSASGTPLSSNKPADLSKDTKPIIGGPPSTSESRSPPTQHHVHSHTHHHTHVGIGYPIPIPTVPPQYSPHYGVLASPAPPTSVIPPYQKPT